MTNLEFETFIYNKYKLNNFNKNKQQLNCSSFVINVYKDAIYQGLIEKSNLEYIDLHFSKTFKMHDLSGYKKNVSYSDIDGILNDLVAFVEDNNINLDDIFIENFIDWVFINHENLLSKEDNKINVVSKIKEVFFKKKIKFNSSIWIKVIKPKFLDVVLFKNKLNFIDHIGIYLKFDKVMHCTNKKGVLINFKDSIKKVEGYYRLK